MPMRWRWPPENSCGIAVAHARARPTWASSSATRSRRLVAARIPWTSIGSATMSPTRHPRIQRRVRVLEDHLHVAAAARAALALQLRDVLAVEASRAAGRLEAAAGCAGRVDLPQPDSPTRPSVSPAATSKLTPSTARHVARPARTVQRPAAEVLGRAHFEHDVTRSRSAAAAWSRARRASSAGSRQAPGEPSPTRASSGGAPTQRVDLGQRGANRQPGGSAFAAAVPGMAGAALRLRRPAGERPQQPPGVGVRGSANRSAPSPAPQFGRRTSPPRGRRLRHDAEVVGDQDDGHSGRLSRRSSSRIWA